MNSNHISDKNEIKSEVENTFTFDCFSFKSLSLDQIAQPRESATARFLKKENKIFASTTSIMVYHLNISSYRLAKDSLILSDNSTAFSSLNSLLDTILFSRASLSNFSLINLLIANDQSISETCSTSRFKSSGILITNSDISFTYNNINSEYINTFFFPLTLISCEDASQTCIWHPVSGKCPLRRSLMRGLNPRGG